MHGSQEALGMLSPMDGAADKLLKGDLSGAVKEAAMEAGGGRVFKAAGKGMAAVKRHAGQLDEAVGVLSHADDAATATATGVRESIEEASSVLAKEGGGVASFNVDGHGSGKWHPTSPEEKEAVLEIQKASMGLIIPIESLQQLKNGNILAASKDFILGRVKFLKLAKKLGARLTAGSSRKCCVAVEAQIVKVPVTKGSVSPLTGCGTAAKSVTAPFKSGEIITREFASSGGPVEMAAEAIINGRSLHLKDIAVFPKGAEKLDIGLKEVMRLRGQLADEVARMGFDSLRITGRRLTGANPGKAVDMTIDLIKRAAGK